MLTLNPNTKRAERLINSAMTCEGLFLQDCYGSFSQAKSRAWNNCFKMYLEEKGDHFHICSHNTNTFSVAWFTDTGVRMETAYNSYFIPMEKAVDKYLHWF